MTININEALGRVQSSIYGKDIRQAIVDAIQSTYDDASKVGNANMEVTKARGAYNILSERLQALDSSILSLANGSPKGVYATLSALQTAFPTGNNNLYVVTADGKWYFWNGTAWTAGGVYQSTSIAPGSITYDKMSSDLRYTFSDLSVIGDEILTRSSAPVASLSMIPFFGLFTSVTITNGIASAVKDASSTDIVGGGLFATTEKEVSFKGLNNSRYIVLGFDGTYVYHIQVDGTTVNFRKHSRTTSFGVQTTFTLPSAIASTSTVKISHAPTTVDIYADGVKVLSIPNNGTTAAMFANRVLGFLQVPTGSWSVITDIALGIATTKTQSMLDDISDIQDALYTSVLKEYDNSDITINKADFSINSDNELITSSNPTMYKWVLFESGFTDFQFTATGIDGWACLYGDSSNVIAVCLRTGVAVGQVRNFSTVGRTDLITGDNTRGGVNDGDVVKISKNGTAFTFTIQRVGTSEFANWFTVDIGAYITPTMQQSFGILTGTQTGVVVVKDMQSESTSIKDSIFDLQSQVKSISSNGGNDPKTVDLIIFMGQSNMAGRGVAAQSPVVKVGTGYEFRAISDPNKLYNLVEPFGVNENISGGINEPGTKTGSMVSSFVIEYNSLTGRPVVAVSASKGGSSINEWQPNSAYLNDSISRYTSAKTWLLNNGYTIKHQFMVWCQGETDGDNHMTATDYTTKITAMIEAMVAQGIEKCYIVRIGNQRDNATLYDTIMQAQTDLCKTYKNAVLVSTKFASMAADGLMKDQFHYLQSGYNTTGADAGCNTAFHIMYKKEPYMYDSEFANLYFSQK
jgi:hypothetical protein